MGEEIIGVRIFAEDDKGILREISMTLDERELWFGVVAKYFNNKFILSPVEVKAPLLKPKS